MKVYSDVRECPYCGGKTKVIQGWQDDFSGYIRRKKCIKCGKLFKTCERMTEEIDLIYNDKIEMIQKELGELMKDLDMTKENVRDLSKRI